MILHLLLLVAFLARASAASLSPTLDLVRNPDPSNVISNDSPALSKNSKVQGDIWSWYCTTVPRWSVPKLEPDDCQRVLEYFYLETMHEGGRRLKNFRAPGSKKSSILETQWTPQKYTFGTCTLAIVMIGDFPDPASLPGGSKTGPTSDISTYYTLGKIAENLVKQCVERRGEMGWQPAGLSDGIGVFIWSTSSDEDKAIDADEPRFAIPVVKAPGNGSVVSG